jgi:hypothetical protein
MQRTLILTRALGTHMRWIVPNMYCACGSTSRWEYRGSQWMLEAFARLRIYARNLAAMRA